MHIFLFSISFFRFLEEGSAREERRGEEESDGEGRERGYTVALYSPL
jgi:hypothetical protein